MGEKVDLIQSFLGDGGERFEYEAGGKNRVGWRAFFERDKRGRKSMDKLVEENWRGFHEAGVTLLKGPERSGDEAVLAGGEKARVRVQQVMALPGASVLDVVELCEVGLHGSAQMTFEEHLESMKPRVGGAAHGMLEGLIRAFGSLEEYRLRFERGPHGRKPWKVVQTAMGQILEIAPLAVQFADSAGFRGTFLRKVTEEEARRIGQIVMGLNPQAMDAIENELRALGIEADSLKAGDMDDGLMKYLMVVGKLRLWWD